MKNCPKCKGEMAEGLLMTPGAVPGVRWNEGKPGILGTIVAKLPKVIAYSCKECGFIENFVEKK